MSIYQGYTKELSSEERVANMCRTLQAMYDEIETEKARAKAEQERQHALAAALAGETIYFAEEQKVIDVRNDVFERVSAEWAADAAQLMQIEGLP